MVHQISLARILAQQARVCHAGTGLVLHNKLHTYSQRYSHPRSLLVPPPPPSLKPYFQHTSPLLSIRCYSGGRGGGSDELPRSQLSGSDIPLSMVKPESVKFEGKQVPTLKTTTNSDSSTRVEGPGDDDKKTGRKEPSSELHDGNAPAQVSVMTRVGRSAKAFIMHYYDGARLLWVEVRISVRLMRKLLNGDKLTRREGNQLRRTVSDMFRIVPLLIFLLIPFLELLLPVALAIFPNLLPSTFESIDKKKEKKLKKLKLKLDLAKFIQETLVTTIPVKKGESKELTRFTEFITRSRTSDPRDDIEELKSFSKLFSDNITIDNVPRSYLVAICQLLSIPTWGPDGALRYALRGKLRELKKDDLVIRLEGLDTLTPQELQTANADRGMRAVGVPIPRLKLQLDQWLKLRLDEEIPVTLLLLTRVMTLPRGPTPSYEDLRNAVAHLPDSLIGEAKISLAAKTGELIDNKARLDAVNLQEELIAKEAEQRKERHKVAEDLDKAVEEKALKEESNTRVAANIQMRKETLKDMAKPILTEDQLEIRQNEIAEIQKIISKLRDKKNPLLEEKEELRELIEKAIEHQKHLEADDEVEEGFRQRLSNRVANTLNRSHALLLELESSLKQDVDKLLDEEDIVLTKSELDSAITEILSLDKKEKLLNIVSILSEPEDGSIKSSKAIQALEKIALEGTDLNAGQIKVVLALAKRHQKQNKPEE